MTWIRRQLSLEWMELKPEDSPNAELMPQPRL
jgi:hypothetical protein